MKESAFNVKKLLEGSNVHHNSVSAIRVVNSVVTAVFIFVKGFLHTRLGMSTQVLAKNVGTLTMQ